MYLLYVRKHRKNSYSEEESSAWWNCFNTYAEEKIYPKKTR